MEDNRSKNRVKASRLVIFGESRWTKLLKSCLGAKFEGLENLFHKSERTPLWIRNIPCYWITSLSNVRKKRESIRTLYAGFQERGSFEKELSQTAKSFGY